MNAVRLLVVIMAEVYVDRKMMKWLPFQSLPEQGEDLNVLYQNRHKQTKPVLSEDQYALMQYRFEEAWQNHQRVTVKVYERGRFKDMDGYIVGADQTLGVLMLDQATILLDSIVEIT